MAAKKPAKKAPAKKRNYDWEAIGREYRMGQLSIREIGRIYGPSDAGIIGKAKKLGWRRDLSDEVRRATRSKLAAEAAKASDLVSTANTQELVEQAATRAVAVNNGHLAMANRLRRILNGGMILMESHLGMIPQLQGEEKEQYLRVLTAEGGIDEDAVRKLFVGRPDGVAAVLRSITEGVDRVQRMERLALAMDDAPPETNDDFRARLMRARERNVQRQS